MTTTRMTLRSTLAVAAVALCVVLCAAAAAPRAEAGAPAPGEGNVRAARVLEARSMVVGSLLAVNTTVRGNLDVGGTIFAKAVKARSVRADSVETTSISSPSGTIVVNGDLIISHAPEAKKAAGNGTATADAAKAKNASEAAQPQEQKKEGETQTAETTPIVKATSFLAEHIVVGGVKQWKLVRHEDFEEGAAGWSLAEVSSCAGAAGGDRFLGGHCNAAAAETRKRFDKLPPHSQVRVTGRYHFIDNWQGETAFLKLGERVAWADAHHAPAQGLGIHMCGSADHAEGRMSQPVDVTMPHSASFLEVAFGSTGKAGEDACQRSFGVDDVMVYVR